MASGEVKISMLNDKAIVRLEKKLNGTARLMGDIGAILLRESMQAFEKQAFGTIKWPERYPNQGSGGKVNIAGAVSDFSHGSTLPTRRFEPRPAAADSGKLKNSISARNGVLSVDAYSVTVGSNKPYANVQHQGGETTQPVSDTVKSNLRKWIKRTRNATPKGKNLIKDSLLLVQKVAVSRLLFLLESDVRTLVTQVNARPFVGITEDARAGVIELVTSEFAG